MGLPPPTEHECHVLATREEDSPLWSFFLVNDSDSPIENVSLEHVKYEWGDEYRGGESPGVFVAIVEPGERALVWKDDGSSEMRTDLWFRIAEEGTEIWLLFEFPKLYRQSGRILTSQAIRRPGPPV